VINLFVYTSAHTHLPHTHAYTHTITHAHTHTYTHTLTLSPSLTFTHTQAREHFTASAAIYSQNNGEDDEETQDARVRVQQCSE